VGPVFYIVSCNCPSEWCASGKKLKSFEMWCEWCRCPSCGGKEFKTQNSHFNNNIRKKFTDFRDISSDLGLGGMLLLLASCCYLYTMNHPYLQVYILGFVGFSFQMHRLLVWFGC
jgi:NAD-dependent SIR2 family protein deacetylase